MPTTVFAMLWARRAETPASLTLAQDAQDIEEPSEEPSEEQSQEQLDAQFERQVRERVDRALAQELPDLIDHATRVFPLPGELTGALRRGYYIIAAVAVELLASSLNTRLDVGLRVESALTRALAAICRELVVERVEIEDPEAAELRAASRWRGSSERCG